MKRVTPFLTLIIIFMFSNVSLNVVEAHSGRTDSSGGHNCNVGSCAGTYHYHNGGTAPSVKSAPVAQPTAKPVVYPTAVPTRVPTVAPTAKPTQKPVSCSANTDNICPSQCTAGNDADCCTEELSTYSWYMNWGCYPTKLSCSAEEDGVCDSYCTAGNDADCCVERLDSHMWYDNWGCYEI